MSFKLLSSLTLIFRLPENLVLPPQKSTKVYIDRIKIYLIALQVVLLCTNWGQLPTVNTYEAGSFSVIKIVTDAKEASPKNIHHAQVFSQHRGYFHPCMSMTFKVCRVL